MVEFCLHFHYLCREISNIIPMTVEQIGKAIRKRREFLKLLQEDLAEMSQLTAKTIYMIESGTGNPSLETINKIATVLGMEIMLEVKKS